MFEPLTATLRDGETIVRFGIANLQQENHMAKYFSKKTPPP